MRDRSRRHALRTLVATSLLVARPAPAGATPTVETWADTGRYRSANARAGAPATGVRRIVFFGDSIIEGWRLPGGLPWQQRVYLNRGIAGQTTAQMLLRWRADALDLRPRAVVLLGGTNDVAGNTGESSVGQIAGYLKSMVQIARAEGVRVVLCSVLPTLRYAWRPALRPAATIVALNAALNEMAAAQGAVWVDFHSAMVDGQGGMQRGLADDGLHPNAAGYARMTALLAPALDEALRD